MYPKFATRRKREVSKRLFAEFDEQIAVEGTCGTVSAPPRQGRETLRPRAKVEERQNHYRRRANK